MTLNLINMKANTKLTQLYNVIMVTGKDGNRIMHYNKPIALAKWLVKEERLKNPGANIKYVKVK